MEELHLHDSEAIAKLKATTRANVMYRSLSHHHGFSRHYGPGHHHEFSRNGRLNGLGRIHGLGYRKEGKDKVAFMVWTRATAGNRSFVCQILELNVYRIFT